MTSDATATPTGAWGGSLKLAAGDIKLAHSVFAMPFALLGAVLAKPDGAWGRFAGQLALVMICMVLARTWAMLVNRIADRRIDAENPRTVRRAVASGALPVGRARTIALACAAIFVLVTSGFWLFFGNAWPLILAVPVLLWIAFYSYTKRFTALCHIFLGGALAASPIAAAIAIDPASLTTTPSLWWIALLVVLWVGGFDVIYALQDADFDREVGLHSIPSALGTRGAIWTSRVLHAGAFAALVLAGRADARLGLLFLLATIGVGGLLIVEHAILARRGRAGIPMAFFTVNGVISCVLGVAGVADVVLG